jgi:CBS domain-containing protein
MRIAEVMVREPITIDASATLIEAARKMREGNVGVLPVVEDGVLRGALTDRDLVVRAIADEADPRTTRVADCATVEPIVAQPDWDPDQAPEVMARHQIGRLPIVDAQNRPIGRVTLSSLALRAADDDEALSTAKEVSRRSARGGRGPAASAEPSASRARGGGRAIRKGAGRAAARREGPKRRLKRAS